jgi:hypothetical protein
MSVMLREAIRALDGKTIDLWLAVEGGGWSGGRRSDRDHFTAGGTGRRHGDCGPQRGVVVIDLDDGSDSFTFHRWGRSAVRLRFDQIAHWCEVEDNGDGA